MNVPVVIHSEVCPKCRKRPDLMAGRNVPRGYPAELYLVCWRDKLFRMIGPDCNWDKLGSSR